MLRNKFHTLTLLYILLTSVLVSGYLFLPAHFHSFDSHIRDFYFKLRGNEDVSKNIIIVDIDEKSLKSVGQWPWEREKVAQILQNLSDAGAAGIALDMLFAEKDKTSPKSVATQWGLKPENLPDYDELLAKTLSDTPTILGYIFDFENVNEHEAPQTSTVYVQKGLSNQQFLPSPKGVVNNLEILQNAAYSSGFINNIPDESGVIRSVPLLMYYDMEIYPSLAFELFRIINGIERITLEYSEAGIERLLLDERVLPVDRFGRLHLNFRGSAKSYKYISAVDVLKQNIDMDIFKDKYVFLGTSAYGLMDLRSTPLESVIPGVELHANLVDNLEKNDMLYKPNWVELFDLTTIFLIAFIVLFLFSRLSFWYLLLFILALIVGVASSQYYLLFNEHFIVNFLFPLVTLFTSFVTLLGVNYFYETRQKELIKESFSKKVSPQVMNDLLSHPNSRDLTAQELVVSIYFSDIRSFTSISEELGDPKKVTDFLNLYMNEMVIPIENKRGTIDKFIGDAIMAYWNAPLAVEMHADRAVESALEQIEKRDELNKVIYNQFGFNMDFGIGINTGSVVVGEIGSSGRSDYTIIGDAVNLASRLEGLCKIYGVRLIISEFTKEYLQQEYVLQFLDKVIVKGKHNAVSIYEVIKKGTPTKLQQEELKKYEEAYSDYLNHDFMQSYKRFELLFIEYNKPLYKLYMNRSEELQSNNLQNFDGVYEFHSK